MRCTWCGRWKRWRFRCFSSASSRTSTWHSSPVPNFNFGGRVHTNGNLFLSEGGGSTLTLTDKVTAVGEIIRQQLQNGVSIDTASAHDGTVSMAQLPGVFRPLLRTKAA